MVQSCIRGDLDLMLGSISLPRGWSNTGNRLPGEVVDAPSLSVLKTHLDNALNNIIELLVSPEVASQLD